MDRASLRAAIKKASEWDPDSTAYDVELNEKINDAYRQVWDSYPWAFSQKTVEMPVHRDRLPARFTSTLDGSGNAGGLTPTTTTAHGTKMPAGYNVFTLDDVGQALEIDGREYEIAEVQSPTVAYTRERYQGASGLKTDWAIRHRDYWLPQDCLEVLGVWFDDLPHPSETHLGSPPGIPQGMASRLALERDETTTKSPSVWQPGPTLAIPKPPETPTAANATDGALPNGTYYLGFAYEVMGAWGPVSASVTHTLTGSNDEIDLTIAKSEVGHPKRIFWGELQSDNEMVWYAAQTTTSSENWDYLVGFDSSTIALAALFNDKYQGTRHQGYDPMVRSIQFWPRLDGTDTKTAITAGAHGWSDLQERSFHLRYRYRPPRLDHDNDVLHGPPGLARAVLDQVVGDLLASPRLANTDMAKVHFAKVERQLELLRGRYVKDYDVSIKRGNRWSDRPTRIILGNLTVS